MTAMSSPTKQAAGSTASTTKKAKKSVKYCKAPQAPKRFKSAFIFFTMERHSQIRKMLEEQGEADKTPDVAKMVSEEWRNLSPEKRAIWDEKARLDKERYEVEKTMYTGPWKIPARKRSQKDPAAPKRPMSSFLSFSNTRRAEVKKQNPGMTNTDASKLLAKMWKEAPKEEKQSHIEREAKLREKYKKDMAEFREKAKKEEAEARERREQMARNLMQHRNNEIQASSERGFGMQSTIAGSASTDQSNAAASYGGQQQSDAYYSGLHHPFNDSASNRPVYNQGGMSYKESEYPMVQPQQDGNFSISQAMYGYPYGPPTRTSGAGSFVPQSQFPYYGQSHGSWYGAGNAQTSEGHSAADVHPSYFPSTSQQPSHPYPSTYQQRPLHEEHAISTVQTSARYNEYYNPPTTSSSNIPSQAFYDNSHVSTSQQDSSYGTHPNNQASQYHEYQSLTRDETIHTNLPQQAPFNTSSSGYNPYDASETPGGDEQYNDAHTRYGS